MKKRFKLVSLVIVLAMALISCEKDNDDNDGVKILNDVIALNLSLSEHGIILNWDYTAGNRFRVFVGGTAQSDFISESSYLISNLNLNDLIEVKSYNEDSQENANGKLIYEFDIESIVGVFENPQNSADYKEFKNDGFGKTYYGIGSSSFTWKLELIDLLEIDPSTGQLVTVKRLGVSYITPHNNKVYYFEYLNDSGSSLSLKDLSDNTTYIKT